MTQAEIDALRSKLIVPQNHLIDGRNLPSEDGGVTDVISPINGQCITTVAAGTSSDAARAIQAARAAFEDRRWAGMPPAERKRILFKWADLIAAESLELAVLGVRDNGTEIAMAIKAEVGSAIGTLRYYAEALDKIYGEIAPTGDTTLGLIHKAPVGVVAAIIPWNFPLMIGMWKLGPALAAGNSVVIKPPESASLSMLRICQLAHEAGLPPGVLNVVTGRGSVVGEALATSMEVDVMAFTGSGPVGRRLLENAARSNMKRCYLELGGKSPNIIFEDTADLAQAAKVSAGGIFRNSGQVCIAGSRLLVQENIAEEFLVEMTANAQAFQIGDPLDLTSHIGAVHSLSELEANLDFVAQAEDEGAARRTGGARILADTGGYYMQPTIMTGVKPSHALFNNEVFGPVLAVTTFKDEEEALKLANATVYGLAAGVWTSNLSRAHRMVAGLRAGVVHVNTYGGADMTVPLGGVKQSGNGQDKSLHALDKYFDLKTAWIQL
jgi:gamma-glutamyl-gamma-aminobutyraldehyde dehydrogenase